MNLDEYERMYQVEDTHWWYHSLHALLDDFVQGAFAAEHAIPHSRRLLDIGCGTGATLHYLESQGWAVGVDISTEALHWCKQRNAAHLTHASAMELPFLPAQFHAAVMLDVLYHQQVPDPLTPLREAHRVLKPGGYLFVNVPAYAWLYSSHDRAVHTARRFTKTQLTRYLNEAGFDVVRASYWNFLLFPMVAAVRLLRKMKPDRGSDLPEEGASPLNTPLIMLLTVERFLLRHCSLPFGLSVFAVARKRG